jgi:hypothetical protein
MPDVKALQRIIEKYPPESGLCSPCAREIFALLDKEGVEARIGYMETDAPFLTTRDGVQLSLRVADSLAYHEFVRVGDTIYDALAGPKGMLWHDYQTLFYEGVFDDGTIRVTYVEP